MLVISLFLSIGIYLVSRNVIVDNVIQNQIGIINNLKTIIDKELETVAKLALRVASDSNLSQLFSNIENKEKLFESIFTVQKFLSNNLYSDSIINEIYLCLYKPNFILTHNNKYTFYEFSNFIQNNTKLKNEDLKSLLKLLRMRNWKSFYIYKNLENNPIFILLQSIPDPSYREFRGIVLIEINSKKIREIIKGPIDPSKYVIGIINKDNTYYISSENKFIKEVDLKYNFLSTKKEVFWISQMKENLCIVHFPSEIAGWEYFSIFSLNLILEKVDHVKRISLVYLFLCLILGILISVVLARRNYNPIKKLIEKASEKVKISGDLSENELRFLDRIFDNVLEQNKRLETELREKNLKLVENILVRLLKENTNYNKNVNKFREDLVNLNLNSKIFLIGVLITQIEDKIFKIEENEEEVDIIYSIVKNTLGDIIDPQYRYFPIEVDGKIIFIISELKGSEFNIEEIKEFLRNKLIYINDFLNKNFGIHTLLGISRVYSSLDMLSLAYDDINTIFEYYEISKTNNRVIFYEEIDKENNITTYDEISLILKKIFEGILTNNYDYVFDCHDKLINAIQDCYRENPKTSKLWIYTYKNIIFNTLAKIADKIDNGEFKGIWNYVQKTNNLTDLKEQYDVILKKAIDLYSDTGFRKPYWIDSIIEYIKSNYKSSQLCVNTIAYKFKISSEHLSRTFKRFVGVNLSDFIHLVRLEKAKKLLEESNLTIREIAEETGFIDSKALIRAFKNYIGITPSKYREKYYRSNTNVN